VKHEPQYFAAQGLALHGTIPPERPKSERLLSGSRDPGEELVVGERPLSIVRVRGRDPPIDRARASIGSVKEVVSGGWSPRTERAEK
jgi:hypothetical protein